MSSLNEITEVNEEREKEKGGSPGFKSFLWHGGEQHNTTHKEHKMLLVKLGNAIICRKILTCTRFQTPVHTLTAKSIFSIQAKYHILCIENCYFLTFFPQN
jgi:hypothetical protein